MRLLAFILAAGLVMEARAANLPVATLANDGSLVLTNAFPQGAVTVNRAATLDGPWLPEKQVFSTCPTVQVQMALSGPAGFFRPRALNFSGVGSWAFATGDIADLEAFADRLLLQDPADAVSEFLWNRFSIPTLGMLLAYPGGANPELLQALVDDLNLIILSGPIYSGQVFADVTLSPSTQALLAQNPQGSALVHLNHMLLQDAYPKELLEKLDWGFTNLVNAYGLLTALAGAGGTTASPTDKWLPEFEGGPATNALLSRPHIAVADRAGNVYIADKEAHAIRKVTPDGLIHTVAGNNVPGYGTTSPVPATSASLYNPNGLWVREDGAFYILDRDNGLIRKVDTNGMMTTLVNHGSAIPEGRGLWVSPDESVLFYSAGTRVMRWDTTNGLSVQASGFNQLGNLAVSPAGRLAVTDRGANQVFQLDSDGTRTVMAGNGSMSGGGDGYPATETGLWQVRGIWFLPTGACFLATDNGSQVWYVDTDGFIHLFLNGSAYSHDGNGLWFYDPLTPKVSKVRQITMDYDGNLIITEHDAGYIRKVHFLPCPH